jgi:large subunit ribosomal protein L19
MSAGNFGIPALASRRHPPSAPGTPPLLSAISQLFSLRTFSVEATTSTATSHPPPSTNIAAIQRKTSIPAAPWTPTSQLVKRKVLTKRMGYLMQVLEQEMEEQHAAKTNHPPFKPGDRLELKLVVPENKRKTTTFKGMVIAKSNRGWRTAFTLRNFIGSYGAVERTFPLYSPHIEEIKVLSSKKVGRSKLYYMRNKPPRLYRV